MGLVFPNGTLGYISGSTDGNVYSQMYIDKSSGPVVGFVASLDNNQNPYTGSGVIPFNSTPYNYGGGFNTSNGYFTAPVEGLYFFDITMMSANNSSYINTYYRLSKNGNVSSSTGSLNQYVYSTSYSATHKNWAGGTLFYLNVNDYVYVYTGNVGLYMNSIYYTRFSGFLVSS